MTTVREGKGKSLIAFPEEYVAVDLETTGMSAKWDEIIEIGAARFRDGKVVETYQKLVNPGFEIDLFIEGLTGITNEMLIDASSIAEVLPGFVSFLGTDTVMVGHNIAGFDSNFLYDAGERIGTPVRNDFVDTMRIARKLHKDWQHHRLSDLREWFGITDKNAHRALADALATSQALEVMRGEAIEAFGSVDDFIKAAKRKTATHGGGKKGFDDIVPTVDAFDEGHPFYGREVVITGTLPGMTRAQAAQEIVNCGGCFSDSLRVKTTNYLVIADYSGCKTIAGKYSGKHEKALKAKAKGSDIEIIDADAFFELLKI